MSILKRSLRSTLCCLTLLALFTCTTLLQADVITIPDDNLRAAIETTLGKETGEPISEDEMAALTELIVGHQGISNLTGLEYGISIERLLLPDNEIEDLSPLRDLNEIRDLNLSSNPISDLSPLSSLSSLQTLGLNSTNNPDLLPLSDLVNLKTLDLSRSQVSDISALGHIIHLEILSLDHNQIADISALGDLVYLERLSLDYNQIAAIPSISGMTSLIVLKINHNQIEDISGLEGVTGLQQLELVSNQIEDISPLSGITDLQWLGLMYNQIQDISPLSDLTNLSALWLSDNLIWDISPLIGMEFDALSLENNHIDISAGSDARTQVIDPLIASGAGVSFAPQFDPVPQIEVSPNPIILVVSPGDSISSQFTIDYRGLDNLAWSANTSHDWISVDPISGIVVQDSTATVTFSIASVPDFTDSLTATIILSTDDPDATTPEISIEMHRYVDIPDANLRARIEAKLGKNPGDPITDDEMATITAFSANSKGISDLTGLNFAVNLTVLELSHNEIADISPLGGLTNLQTLNINHNNISDISILRNLTNLRELFIGANKIEDISPISSLTRLEDLVIGGNQIVDISALSGLENLQHLSSYRNLHEDISPLSGLASLQELWLIECGITDISALSGLTNLQQLWLSGCIVKNFTPLSGLTNLQQLWLSGCGIRDLSTLSGLPGLQTLSLTDNYISDLSALSSITSIQDLDLSKNRITDVSPLSGLTNLQILSLNRNYELADISSLNNLSNLQDLSISDTKISDITAISGMTGLEELSLIYNQITKIPPLDGLTRLQSLIMSDNQITDISGLSGLTNLQILSLNHNQIVDISGLSGVTSLQYLNLAYNLIADVTPLAGINFSSLNLSWNYIDISEGSDSRILVIDPLIAAGGSCSWGSQNKLVNLDANLRTAIETELGKNPGDTITAIEVASMTSLNAGHAEIRRLDGLEFATNLRVLWIQDNQITDLSPLSGLTNLEELRLYDNKIADLSPLSGLTQLQQIQLHDNQITDISPLGGLTNLQSLTLSDNQIVDISSLEYLENLQFLYLDYNQIREISSLAGKALQELAIGFNYLDVSDGSEARTQVIDPLVAAGGSVAYTPQRGDPVIVTIPDDSLRAAIEIKLEKNPGDPITDVEMATMTNLYINNENVSNLTGLEYGISIERLNLPKNEIEDLSPLRDLNEISYLDLSSNPVSDFSPLSNLSSLQTLILGYTYNADLSTLSGLINLKRLNLSRSQISDISALGGLVNLESLSLDFNQVSDISALGDLENLKSLSLDFNQITDISALGDLVHLEGLSLDYNQISDIPSISGMTSLKILKINHNQIEDISGLEGVTSLQQLQLVLNQIEDISPLSGMTNLLDLGLMYNQIQDISPLSGLTNLNSLWLSDNKIWDISPLIGMEFESLSLENNYIDISAGSDARTQVIDPLIAARHGVSYTPQYAHPPVIVTIPDDTLRAALETELGKIPGDPITDAEMATLTELTVENMEISSLEGLEKATSLTSLILRNNQITDISPISGLTNLQVLNLASNLITEISLLSELTDLQELDLDNNAISDISPLGSLTSLRVLSLEDNQIDEISALSAMPGIESLGLKNNYIDISDGSEARTLVIDPLVAGGKQVNYTPQYSTYITIPDDNLRAAIEDALGLNSEEPVTIQQMATLTFLYGADIEDFTGLEKAVNLSGLTLGNCNLSDLSPISKISKLSYLDLTNCQFSDLSPLSNLKYLYDLILSNNQISDLSGLSSLRYLPNLSLSNNQISDLTPLANLTGLRKLFLNQNLITDISPLAGLTGLNNLVIKDNYVDVLEERNAQTLSTLREAGVSITKYPQYIPQIGVPSDTVELLAAPGDIVTHSFIINSNGTAALEFELATDCDWITADMASGTLEAGQQIEVELTIGEIPEYTGSLSAMISITSNDPSDPIVEFPIEISYQVDIPDAVLRAEIESALGLEPGAPVSSVEMVTLTELDVNQRGIQDLTGLESAINLEQLKLAYNIISDISAISSLQHLTYLDLSGNQVSDISPLTDLSNLQYLYLSENQLTDISILENLANLQELHLQNNHLYIADGSSAQAVISSLEQAGVVIEYEPQLIPSILVDNDTITLAGSPGDTLSYFFQISNPGTDHLAYSFASSSDWFTTSPDSGTIDPGNSADIELILSDLPSFKDVLNAELSITSNDPGTPVIDVQIEIYPPIDIPDPNLRSILEEAIDLESGAPIIAPQLANLTELDASERNIVNLSGIGYAVNLVSLDLGSNLITDLAPLQSLSSLEYLNIRMNLLDIRSESDDWQVLNQIDAYADVHYDPQRYPMRSYADFLVDHSIPEGRDGYQDKNGPLEIPNLMAFAMGIDPMTAAPGMLPQAVRDEAAGTCSFCFHRNLAAMDVDLLIESSTDMATWAPVSPQELNILSDDGDGQQYVEAIFEEEETMLFRVRAVPDGQ